MINYLTKAAENFCIHQIREEHLVSDGISKKRTLIAYIDIQGQTSFRVYLASDENMMRKICEIYLMEDNADEQTLIDMVLETANMIIGSAKVIASEESDVHFTIETPNFETFDIFSLDVDASKIITIGDNEMMIAIKER